MPSNHLILCRPLLLLPSIFPSIRVFSNESILHMRWPKYWSFSFNISPSNEHPGLISFRMDWLDLLEVQGTLQSLLQHHSSKASIVRRSAFSIVQLSHPYMTTGAGPHLFPNSKPPGCQSNARLPIERRSMASPPALNPGMLPRKRSCAYASSFEFFFWNFNCSFSFLATTHHLSPAFSSSFLRSLRALAPTKFSFSLIKQISCEYQ